jgi:hypothetical protein
LQWENEGLREEKEILSRRREAVIHLCVGPISGAEGHRVEDYLSLSILPLAHFYAS